MWITEWGWPIGPTNEGTPAFTEDTVAAWLPRAFVLAQAAGTEALCWFSTQDSVDGPMGLTANDGTRRRTFDAYKALGLALGGYDYVLQLEGANHPTTGTQAYLFRNSQSAKIVDWSVEPASAWLKLTGPLGDATITDNFGRNIVTDKPSDRRVKLGAAPIYVDVGTKSDLRDLSISSNLDQ